MENPKNCIFDFHIIKLEENVQASPLCKYTFKTGNNSLVFTNLCDISKENLYYIVREINAQNRKLSE